MDTAADTRFTLICYKEDSTESCKGCVMERYSSDFQIYHEVSFEAVALKLANMMLTNKKSERGEAFYEFTLLINGEDSQWTDAGEAIYARARTLVGEMVAEELERANAAAAAQEVQRQAEALVAAESRRQRELAELRRLKNLYEGEAE